ncbi:MAG TPA: oligopeptide transporter, OPT family [Candidatus Polarisedimenticolia bacterium]|nr:oligopeptide transporter, OPT family [Candidatus Polarisedimenticolia bacterium]
MAEAPEKQFQPYVPANSTMAEFTPKAVIAGSIFGIIFGAATVYLALTAGLTVTASIPIAVLSISLLRPLRATILENNIVQTIGSAGESIAAGVAFTIPALIFLQSGAQYFNYWNIFSLAAIGGTLGVLFMVPLRRALIVQEHGVLPYPEGTAAADVLIAGEKGGNLAKQVFAGLGIAALYRVPMSILGLWKETPLWSAARNSVFPRATVACDVTPEYLGVGYIIGPKIAGVLVAGGVLSYLVLIPLIAILGDQLPLALKPADAPIGELDYSGIRLSYVRFIGAGAVAAAGLITLIKTLPTIVAAFRESFKSLRDLKSGQVASRTERDLPITFVLLGSLALVGIVAVMPQLPAEGFLAKLLMGVLIVVFGFFFVTVSSRIVGIIGSSSNPISGMTIATLMATCLIFVGLGWTGDVYQSLALCVGAMVCIAAANAGNTSQDLKTGFLVGATPRWQQIGLIVGVAASVLAIGFTLRIIDNAEVANQLVAGHAIGSPDYPAPQATLMATIIQGLLARDLPWGLIFVGMAIAVVIELCGVKSLSFAVGLYLPLSTTLPIFVGGMLRGLIERKSSAAHGESEISTGMLYATGLVAGGALTGVLIAGMQGIKVGEEGSQVTIYNRILDAVGIRGWEHLGGWSDLIAVAMFTVLCITLVRAARQKLS